MDQRRDLILKNSFYCVYAIVMIHTYVWFVAVSMTMVEKGVVQYTLDRTSFMLWGDTANHQ